MLWKAFSFFFIESLQLQFCGWQARACRQSQLQYLQFIKYTYIVNRCTMDWRIYSLHTKQQPVSQFFNFKNNNIDIRCILDA